MSKTTILIVLMFGHLAATSLYSNPKTLNIKVFLEGAYDPVTGTMKTVLNTGSTVPLAQPYNAAPWNYSGAESVAAVPAGVVDWVLVELREAATPADANPAMKLAGWPRAFLLKNDGSIVDPDGTSQPNLGTLTVTTNLYVVIHHRSHLSVMSSAGATLTGDVYGYDFTTGLAQAYGGALGYKMAESKAVMVAGDIDHDGNIFVSDYNGWAAGFGSTSGYYPSDLDMDRNVYVSDYNKWATNFGSTTSVGIGRTLTDSRDGHQYKLITIGTQIWMAENLAYLPSVDPSSSTSVTTPYYYVYGYQGSSVSEAMATVNYTTYGVLYNWPAAVTACPSGWHLPTEAEFTTLTNFLGGSAGGKLKETSTAHWGSPNTGATNTSGFTALPGGILNRNWGFVYLGGSAYFLSSSTDASLNARFEVLDFNTDVSALSTGPSDFGYSVRCLQN